MIDYLYRLTEQFIDRYSDWNCIEMTRACLMFCTYDWLSSSDINEVTAIQNFDLSLEMMTSSTMRLRIFSTCIVLWQWHIFT